MRRLLAFVALAGGAIIGLRAEGRDVFLRAADGTSLAAALYEPAQRPAPAVVLLHMLTRTRADWDATAERLRQAGFVVLALDLRGHGGSAGSPAPSGAVDAFIEDAHAALAYVKSRPGVVSGRVGIAGASLGASLAAMVASVDPSVQSLALLSPALDYRGLKCEAAMRKYGDRAVFLIAAAGDPYAVRSVKQLATGGSHREVFVTDVTGHGTVLLSRYPPLMDQLVDWFRRTLL
jgi:alpha-beta hydrolase superfamily lysophospholipase